MATQNITIHALAGTYVLAFAPHVVTELAMWRWTGIWNNSSPRGNVDHASKNKKLTLSQEKLLRRAEGAHINALESYPLFVAAILAANYAGLPVPEINKLAINYIISRILYIVAYLGISSHQTSIIRTLIWFYNNGICLSALLKSGSIVYNK